MEGREWGARWQNDSNPRRGAGSQGTSGRESGADSTPQWVRQGLDLKAEMSHTVTMSSSLGLTQDTSLRISDWQV